MNVQELRLQARFFKGLKLSQNDNFVSKYPSLVAAILKPCFRDHVTPIFQPTPISDPGPQSSWASTWWQDYLHTVFIMWQHSAKYLHQPLLKKNMQIFSPLWFLVWMDKVGNDQVKITQSLGGLTQGFSHRSTCMHADHNAQLHSMLYLLHSNHTITSPGQCRRLMIDLWVWAGRNNNAVGTWVSVFSVYLATKQPMEPVIKQFVMAFKIYHVRSNKRDT